MSISVIIPSLGGDLCDTLDSINSGSIYPDEIIICLPNSTHYVKNSFKYNNVIIIYSGIYGQVYQRICGFKKAKCDYVMQIDDDVVVLYNCIELLLLSLTKLGKNTAVSPCWYQKHTEVPLHQGKKSGFFMRLYYWVINSHNGYSPGKISLAGTNFGINPNEIKGDIFNVDWQPGGLILHKKENLILDDFYPYKGKAYSEDLIHSLLLRKSGTSLFVVTKAKCMTSLNKRLSMKKEMLLDFKAKLYFVRMANLSVYRMLFHYLTYNIKSIVLACKFNKNNFK